MKYATLIFFYFLTQKTNMVFSLTTTKIKVVECKQSVQLPDWIFKLQNNIKKCITPL